MYNQMVLCTGIAQASAGGCSSIKHNRTIDPILLNDTSIIRHVQEDKKSKKNALCISKLALGSKWNLKILLTKIMLTWYYRDGHDLL